VPGTVAWLVSAVSVPATTFGQLRRHHAARLDPQLHPVVAGRRRPHHDDVYTPPPVGIASVHTS
jgi:hypothetical protein